MRILGLEGLRRQLSFILHMVTTPAQSRGPGTQEMKEGKAGGPKESETPHKALKFHESLQKKLPYPQHPEADFAGDTWYSAAGEWRWWEELRTEMETIGKSTSGR